MGTINVLGKWDLEKWYKILKGREMTDAEVDYNPIINDNEKINYIIID